MLKIDSETPEQAILRVLSEDGHTQPVTLHRIVAETGGHSPRAISNALLTLRRENLVDQAPGAHGRYMLTETGAAYANLSPEPPTLKEVLAHPGGDALNILTGELAIGTDATRIVRSWQLWDAIGTIPFLAIGGSGTGGTGLLSGLVEAALGHYPDARVWLIDDNRQMADYWDRVERVAVNDADDFAGRTGDLLDDVLRVQRDRARLLAQSGKKGWNGPFDDLRLPLGILVIGFLDEIVRDPELRQKLGTITKAARKTGILVATHVHSPALDSFANDMVLQDFFAAGNILTLRQSTSLFGRMVTRAMEKFKPLPRAFDDGSTTAGLGYLADGTLIRAYWASGL